MVELYYWQYGKVLNSELYITARNESLTPSIIHEIFNAIVRLINQLELHCLTNERQ